MDIKLCYYCQSPYWDYPCALHKGLEGPFRYFDLPIEIRYNILELLLVRGTVAMTQDVAIEQRFRQWKHERPEWTLLSAVSRQMQKEASNVVYSAKNTFFVPLGSINDDGWWCIPRPFPQVKRLDIAFDMRDVVENSAYTLALVKSRQDHPNRTPERTPFEELTEAERWYLLHEEKKGLLAFDVWPSKASACMGISNLDLLRLDLTKYRCLVGCCRMGPDLLELLDIDHDEDYEYPKRIEIVGILEREQHACRDALARYGGMPQDRVFFVDSPGCTCNEGVSCDSIS